MNPHATNPAMVHPTPNQLGSKLTSHCLLDGKYSMNTVVSRIRLPPAPKAPREMNKPSDSHVGEAPATIVKIAQMKREMLNAILRPMMSAKRPQNMAPTSMPRYKAMVRPLS